ncbi:hypothetical protein GOODEAATRI_009021 [Goodea atripinnis]|uniref:G-protein coupled receptors family 1 profile domain-containing protein n=1 Tax=Goodea atripinnis TaxID=208336 RepID=A0ABV0NT13_9TELE
MRNNKPELPPALLHFSCRDQDTLLSACAFTPHAALVTYMPKKGRNMLLLSTLHCDGVDVAHEHWTRSLWSCSTTTPTRRTAYELFFDNSTANTNTSDGSADFDLNVHEPCTRALSGNFNKIFLPMVYGIIFTLGIIGNGLVVLIVGYQKTVKLRRISTSISLSLTSCSSSRCSFGQWTLSRRGTSEASFACRPGCTGRKLLRLPLRGGQRGFQGVLSAHRPSGKRSDVDGGFLLPAHPAKGQVLKKKKPLKKTVILVVCFFGYWLPYCLCIFVDTLGMLNVIVFSSCEVQQAVETWISVTEALAHFHCCLNPILYAFLGVKFNQTGRSMSTTNPLSVFSVFSPDCSGSSDILGPNHPPSPYVFHSTSSLSSSSGALSPDKFVELSTLQEETEEEGESVVDSDTGPGRGMRSTGRPPATHDFRELRGSVMKSTDGWMSSTLISTPAPACQLIADNYSYLTAVFTASLSTGSYGRRTCQADALNRLCG